MTTPGRLRPGPRLPDGIPLGRLAGIRLVLSWSWLLSVVVITALAVPVLGRIVPDIGTGAAVLVGILLAVLLGLSVLIHELGHCLAARLFGLPVLQVRLYLLGGVSELGRSPATPREESVIAAAGPALSALLGALFFLLAGSAEDRSVTWLVLLQLALSNTVVAIFNLLPALPLDGGRVLRAGVWRATGRRSFGTKAAVYGGYLASAALVVWGVWQISHGTTPGYLQGGIGIATALFVLAGATAEHRVDGTVDWPADTTMASLAEPVVQLPSETPVGLALQAAGSRAVILVDADGIADGLLDPALAVPLARQTPQVPAVRAARRLDPEQIVLAEDDPADLATRVRSATWAAFVLIDPSGHPVGVLSVDKLGRILAGRGT